VCSGQSSCHGTLSLYQRAAASAGHASAAASASGAAALHPLGSLPVSLAPRHSATESMLLDKPGRTLLASASRRHPCRLVMVAVLGTVQRRFVVAVI
jgi:hypothetical protein